jgi:SAM-dependent methyltransferase
MLVNIKKTKCPITNTNVTKKIFLIKKFPIYMGVVNKNYKTEFKDMIFNINKNSGIVQIHPKIPLKKLYFKSHGSGKIGNIWLKHHTTFYNFISRFMQGNIVEIGGGHNSMSRFFKNKEKKNYKFYSFDPNGAELKQKNFILIKNFFSLNLIKKIELTCNVDLVLHSHLFEHIYDHNKFLFDIRKIIKPNGYMAFSIPNMHKMIKNGYANAVNFEHPAYLDEELVDAILVKNNFSIIKKKYFKEDHSIFYLARPSLNINKVKYNNFNNNLKLFRSLSHKWITDVKKINIKISNYKNVFLFGAHIFSQMLIANGLNLKNIRFVLDNDPDKNDHFLYGSRLLVKNPIILKDYENPAVVLRAGAYNNEIKKDILSKINSKVIFI